MRKNVMAAIASVLFLTDAWADDRRDVVNVEKVNVEVAVGHAPRLPYQLWVTYGDGSGTMDMIERAVKQLKEIINQ